MSCRLQCTSLLLRIRCRCYAAPSTLQYHSRGSFGLLQCLRIAAVQGHAEPTIVYTLTKREADEVAAFLGVRLASSAAPARHNRVAILMHAGARPACSD
jgi:hypothetical protein